MTRGLLKEISSLGLAGVLAIGLISGATDAAFASGAKKSVAVAKCDGNGAFLSYYGGWDAGGGLSAILATELSNSEQLIVVNRTELDAALYEQSLALQGLTKSGAVQAGQLVNAQYLVRCSVSEFSANEKGSGFSIGGTKGSFLGAISPQQRKAHIGIDVQVFNASTSQIVTSFKVSRKVKRRAIAVNLGFKNVTLGGSKFKNDVLGEAVREALSEAAEKIAAALSGQSWTAQVAQVRGGTLYVNAGRNSGLQVGDTLIISRTAERIVDPMTGAVLGVEQSNLGTATITEVQEQYAKATFRAAAAPMIGDNLILTSNGSYQVSQR